MIPLDATDAAQVASTVKSVQPDGIFHLAAQSVPRYSWQIVEETFQLNIAGTLHLLQAIRQHAPKTKFLFVSSVQVYGRTFCEKENIDEDDLLYPQSPYAASKAIAESACLNFAAQFDLQVLIARPVNHLGSGQKPDFVFSQWCQQLAQAERGLREPVLEVGNVDVERDFLHVEDVASAYRILMEKGRPGTIYNVASGKTARLKDYLGFLLQKCQIPIKVRVQRNRFRKYDPVVMSVSARRLMALGWKPQRSSFEALEELFSDWRKKTQQAAVR